MIFAVSNLAWKPEERLGAYRLMAEAGVTGLEIAPSLFFAGTEDPFRPDATRAALALKEIGSHGLSLVSMQSLLFGASGADLLGDANGRTTFMVAMRRAIDLCGRFGIPNLVFGSPGQRRIPEGMPTTQAWSEAAEMFRSLGEHAGAAGTKIAIEPNSAVYGTNFLTTLEEAQSFVNEVDHPAVAVNLDLGTMWLNGSSSFDVARAAASTVPLAHVHVSEAHLAPAPDTTTDLVPLLLSLFRAGYHRAVSIEMRRAEGGLDTLRGCIARLQSAVAMAEARA